MSDPLEARLRRHLADRAAAVEVAPDPVGFIHRSVRRRRRTGAVAGGLALAVVLAGAGVAGGASLAGGGASPTSARSEASPFRPGPGASTAPGGAGPAIVGQTALAPLFTRTTPSGVIIRVYALTGSAGPGCAPTGSCPPTGTVPAPVPCPAGALCARPMVEPPQTSPADGSTPGTAGSPPVAPPSCSGLIIEMSTDRAVATATAAWPTTPPAAPGTLAVLGAGSFGAAEGGPVGWVAVQVGTGIASVRFGSGGGPGDTMAPSSGVAVLAAPGGSSAAGADVTGLDPQGATVATASSAQVSGGSGCRAPVPPTATPPTSPSTTVPPTTPSTTTTTTPATTPATTPPTPTTTAPTVTPTTAGRVSPGAAAG